MPMNRPDTMMITSDRTPVKYTSRITRRKRLKLVPEDASTRPKKRAITPARQMPSITFAPSRASGRLTRSSIGAPRREADVHRVGPGCVMERDGAVGLAVHELAHERILRDANLGRGSRRDDAPLGDEIEIVHDLQ